MKSDFGSFLKLVECQRQQALQLMPAFLLPHRINLPRFSNLMQE